MTSALHLTEARIDYKGLVLVKFITGSRAFSELGLTEATAFQWIFLKKIHFA
jgi:hypothetical protein